MNQVMSNSNASLLKHFTPYKVKKGEEYMNKAQEEHFKVILHAWKQDLMEEVDRTVNHLKKTLLILLTLMIAPAKKKNFLLSSEHVIVNAS